MKKFVLTVLLLALMALTPTASGEGNPVAGPSVVFNNVFQTLGECQTAPRVSGVMSVCGQTLIVKAGGVP